MDAAGSGNILLDHVQWILTFGLLALIGNGIAYALGFYRLPLERPSSMRAVHVGAVFAIYLVGSFVIPLLLAPLQKVMSLTAFFGWSQLIKSGAIAALLYLYLRTVPGIKAVWKDSPSPIARDFWIGVCTWFVAFPLVAVIGQIFDMLLYYFLHVETYEQNAVQFLKMMLHSPVLLSVALIAILIAAPVIEELMFRGCLQSWLRRHLGAKAAILLSALCFALFHFAFSQSYGNLSIIVTLFGFSCFLGFIYEKQGSLYASIGLHMAFNTASVLRIVFGPE